MAETQTPSRSLPPEVVTCLQNARFLHLATAADNVPHISLMNYTYLPSTPFRSTPVVIMTTPPASSSKKTANLLSNPQVSLLVHDWVSHRPPTLSSSPDQQGVPVDGGSASGGGGGVAAARSSSPSGRGAPASSLAALLLGINSASLSRISVTLNGEAEILSEGSDEAGWCKARHKENNTFDSGRQGVADLGTGIFGGGGVGGTGGGSMDGDGGASCYIEGDANRVIVVKVMDGRISDWQGRVEDWVIEGNGRRNTEAVVNGI